MYDLKSVSDDYEAFLNAIGIPSFAVFFILRGSETLEMEILEDGSVKSKTITGDGEIRSALSLILSLDFVTQDHYYEFDKEWEMEYGKGMGVMHVVCTREKPHILMCRYIVSWLKDSMIHVAFYQDQRSETKDGELTTNFSFMSRVPSVWGHSTIRISVRGRSCLDHFILISFSAAKKYYQRRGVAGSLFKEEASEEYSFFSNEEDDDFFSDEDDDDEFWDDWFY